MSEIIIYLLKVMALQGLMFLYYRLVLKHTARHALNRGYLLGALVLSFVIPFIDLSIGQQTAELLQDRPVIHWITEPTASLEELDLIPVAVTNTHTVWTSLPILYVAIALVLLIRSVIYLRVLHKLKRNSVPIKKRWYTLFKTSHDRPFSFFSNVFMPYPMFGSDAFGQVLAHECVHVKLFHSMDRLLLDFAVSLFWFNPFIYLYRNALIEIHEYQADEEVVRRFKDPIGYQEILFSQLQSPQYTGLVSHFNVEMIKKRIVMMNKPKKMTGWIYALTVPVVLTLILSFSSKEITKPMNDVGNEFSELIGPITEIKDAALDLIQEENKPSILPLKNTDDVRMTSGFGKRVDPMDKTEKFHRGIDFATPTGNPVVATADGVIERLTTDSKHGNRIEIRHGDVYQSAYSHLSSMDVTKGQKVKKGDVIGLSGNTGASTAPHLHYEVKKEGEVVDPIFYIENFTFKSSSLEEAEKRLYEAERQRAVAEVERKMANEVAEQAKLEEQRAKEMQMKAAEAERQAYQQRLEAEELRIQQELIEKEGELLKKQKDKVKKKNKVKKDKQSAYKILVDPGHGGEDAGAISPSGASEKEISLAIAIQIKAILGDEKQFVVVLTHDKDEMLSLSKRVEMTASADLLISLHTDNYDQEGSFIFPVYFPENEFSNDSKQLANYLVAEFEQIGKETKVGYSYDYKILKDASCPAVLFNYGFFSDPIEDQYLSSQEGQREVALRISNAIRMAVL